MAFLRFVSTVNQVMKSKAWLDFVFHYAHQITVVHPDCVGMDFYCSVAWRYFSLQMIDVVVVR